MCTINCFSTAKMVERTRLNVTFIRALLSCDVSMSFKMLHTCVKMSILILFSMKLHQILQFNSLVWFVTFVFSYRLLQSSVFFPACTFEIYAYHPPLVMAISFICIKFLIQNFEHLNSEYATVIQYPSCLRIFSVCFNTSMNTADDCPSFVLHEFLHPLIPSFPIRKSKLPNLV